jgi:hypothetical protein
MPYAKSVAFKSFESRIAELRKVVRAASRLRIGGRANKTYRDAMLSSSLLLSFAYFEAYVADVTNDVCKALCSVGVSAASFARDLRAHVAVASRLRQWSDVQDPIRLRQQIWVHKDADGFVLLDDSAMPARIDVDLLLSGVGYPKPENIKKLLSRLGIGDPNAQLRRRGGHAVIQKLTSVHDARAELAHTGRMPGWTFADYDIRLLELRQFARAMDHVLWNYVVDVVPATAWIR